MSHVEKDLYALGKYYAILKEIVEGKFEEKAAVEVLRRVEKVTGNRSSFCQNPALTSYYPDAAFEHEAGLSTFISKPNLL